MEAETYLTRLWDVVHTRVLNMLLKSKCSEPMQLKSTSPLYLTSNRTLVSNAEYTVRRRSRSTNINSNPGLSKVQNSQQSFIKVVKLAYEISWHVRHRRISNR